MEGLLVGLLYVLLYVIILAIVVYVIIYVLGAVGFPLPDPIPKLIWAAFAVIVLIMLISVLLGWNPRFRAEGVPGRAFASLSVPSPGHLPRMLTC